MKKFLTACLAICFAISAVACNGGNAGGSSTDGFTSSDVENSSSETSSEDSAKDSSSTDSSDDNNLSDVLVNAKEVVDLVLTRPNTWSFLPESFQEENMAYSESALPITDFTNNTSVSAIGDKFIGSQMMVLYDGLLTMQSVLSKIDVVFALGEGLASAYQLFINNNPNDYATFTTALSGFNIKLELDDAKSKLLIGNSILNVELYADSELNENSGRIQLTDGASLKYEMTDNTLMYAYQVGVGSLMRTVAMSFARNDDVVAGYVYEFTGINGTGLTTTAVFSCDEDYTKVVAKKRESDDLIVLGNEEVYDSRTGKYVSGVVSETTKLVDYETYWFALDEVSGLDFVKVLNDGSKDSVYVNGSSTIFEPKKNLFSRKFDIEMKTVYYLKSVQVDEDIKYETVKTSIPMLFVQTNAFEQLGDDMKEKNSSAFTTAPSVSTGIAEIALQDFETLKGLFEQIQVFTYESVVEYIGEKDSFFII